MNSLANQTPGNLCRACNAPLSRTFVDLGVSPLSNSFVPADNAECKETVYPLHTFVCEKCFLVQLAQFEAPENIFCAEYAYFSSYSTSWLRHAENYVEEMIERFGIGPQSHVAEVASNDGYLLQFFHGRGIPVTGIEPAANCAAAAREKGIPTMVRFFGTESAREIAAKRGRADLMAANNVLAHVPDIHDFIGGFREMLNPEGVATFEFPHLMNLIACNQFDTIYHEHFSYLALGPVQQVLEAHGMRVFDVQELPTHGGSLRVFTCPEHAAHPVSTAVSEMLEREREAGLTDLKSFDAFAPKVVTIKNDVLEFLIDARRRGKQVAAYGAAAKGNTLLNYCGVGKEYVSFVVDKNPVKQNTLLPGSRIPVLPVETVYERRPDYLVILPWNLRDEITQQMSDIRDWGGKFVVCIPSLEVF